MKSTASVDGEPLERAMKQALYIQLKRWLQKSIVLALMIACVWPLGKSENAQAQNASGLRISAADEQAILRDARLRRVGNHYLAPECDDPLQVRLDAVDLNQDGKPEVILTVSGSPCFSGLMQSNVSVYVRSAQGRWREVLGFVPAFGVRVQPTRTKGYADLALTVLGGCDPVYRWAGASYLYATQTPGYGQNCTHAH